jgi:hypothetical protein
MKFYVDGNDLLAYFAEEEDPFLVRRDAQKSRDELARWLARYCETSNGEALLVFDENPPRPVLPPIEHVGRVTGVNTPFGVGAATEIAGPANRAAVQQPTAVVTSDRRLMEALERGRARVVEPAQFVSRARKLMRKADEDASSEPDEKFTGLTEGEVDFWLEYFKGED